MSKGAGPVPGLPHLSVHASYYPYLCFQKHILSVNTISLWGSCLLPLPLSGTVLSKNHLFNVGYSAVSCLTAFFHLALVKIL